jgi:hypothetical protein
VEWAAARAREEDMDTKPRCLFRTMALPAADDAAWL